MPHKAPNPVRSVSKAQFEEFAVAARDAETVTQVLEMFAAIMLRHSRRGWVEDYWAIIRRELPR